MFTNRTDKTRVGCSLSVLVDLLCGVVQGSGLRPVSFLIFIDDLAKILGKNGIVAIFADDVKLYRVAYLEISNADDCDKLKKALISLLVGPVSGSCAYQ